MNNFLSIGGGAAGGFGIQANSVIDEMQSNAAWTADVGIAGSWSLDVSTATYALVEAHAGPHSAGGNWLKLATGAGTYDGTHTAIHLRKSITSNDMSTIHDIGFYFAIDMTWSPTTGNMARLGSLRLTLGSDGDMSFSNAVTADHPITAENFVSGRFMRYISFSREDFAALAGDFDWSAVQDVRIEMHGSGGTVGTLGNQSVKAYFQGLQINNYHTPTVVITHDDGPLGVYTLGKPVLDAYGYKSTQFVYPAGIDGGSIMTIAQAKEMYAEGHDICLHSTYSGDVLNTMTLSEVATDLALGLAWCDTNGFTRCKHINAYPQGTKVASGGEDVADTFVDAGVTVGRGTVISYTPDEWSATDKLDTGKNNKCMWLPRRNIDATFLPDPNLTEALNITAKYGGALILNFHNVLASGASAPAINLADYEAALAIINKYESRGQVQVKVMSDVFDTSGSLKI